MSIRKNFFLLLGLLVTLTSWSQVYVEGQVLDAETREPLPFVNVTYNGLKAGTIADIDGYFRLQTEGSLQFLDFSYIGYDKKRVPIQGTPKKPLRVLLKSSDITLMEATVFPGENPALRIIRNASAARETNDPLELDAFAYESYNKLIFTLDADSLSVTDSTGAIDSSNFELKKFFNRSHLFMMESATERKYIKNSRDHEKVLASRTSGFQNPTFSLIGTQLQSFSFYKDELEILSSRFLNPLRKNSSREYFFLLTDTVFNSADRDTVYIIQFRPKNDSRADLLTGTLYIGTEDYSLRNVSAVYSYSSETGFFEIIIQQKYDQHGGHWFPVQLMTDLIFSGFTVNGVVPHGYGRTYIRDISINPQLEKSDIPRLELSMDKDAFSQSEEYWTPLRTRPLDSLERETYVVIDSIGDEVDLEKRVGFLTNLFRGKLRFGYVDFDIQRFGRFNIPYEGIRLGAGAHSNEKLSKNVTFGGYFAYGLKDFDWKYGGDIVYKPLFDGPVTFQLKYERDLFEMGGREMLLDRKPSYLSGGNIRWYTLQQFDMVERLEFSSFIDLLPNLKLGLSVASEDRENKRSNRISDITGTPVQWTGMIYGIGLEWAPNDRYMVGPNGRERLGTTYPILMVDYKYGTTDAIDPTFSDDAFHRLSLRVVQRWNNLRYGDLRVEAAAGGNLGSTAPASFLFAPRANLHNGQLPENPLFGFGSPHSFETLFNNEFTSDLQVQLMADYYFPKRVLKIGDWSPQLIMSQRFLWGQLENPLLYQGTYASVVAPEDGFFESGVEIQGILSTLGVGVYYRYGSYSREEIGQNIAIKVTSSGLF